MQYSDTTNKDGIIQMVEGLAKLGDGGITSNTTLFPEINGFVNQAYKKVIVALMKVDKYWKWDDSHYSDFPIATITLVNGQRDYTLPAATLTADSSTFYKLNRVRVLMSDGVTWKDLTLLDLDTDESTDISIPTNYRLIGNSIRVSPMAATGQLTLTNGLEIQFQRGGSYFTSSDLTKQPAFNEGFHDLLAYDAAATYLLPYNPDLADRYTLRFNARLVELQNFYAQKNTDVKPRLVPKRQNNK